MKRGCLISPLEYDDVMLRSNRQRLLTFHIFAVYVSVCCIHNVGGENRPDLCRSGWRLWMLKARSNRMRINFISHVFKMSKVEDESPDDQ